MNSPVVRILLENKGWRATVKHTGVQLDEDGNTCGYHVLQWAKQLQEGGKTKARWRPEEY